MRRVAALRGTENSIPDFERRRASVGRGGEDNAGEFGARDPGEGRLMLVLSADLEKVKEIGCGGVDGDEIVGR